jgi:hypothetical protein
MWEGIPNHLAWPHLAATIRCERALTALSGRVGLKMADVFLKTGCFEWRRTDAQCVTRNQAL